MLQGFLFHGRGATADRLKFKSAPIDKNTTEQFGVPVWCCIDVSRVCVCVWWEY